MRFLNTHKIKPKHQSSQQTRALCGLSCLSTRQFAQDKPLQSSTPLSLTPAFDPQQASWAPAFSSVLPLPMCPLLLTGLSASLLTSLPSTFYTAAGTSLLICRDAFELWCWRRLLRVPLKSSFNLKLTSESSISSIGSASLLISVFNNTYIQGLFMNSFNFFFRRRFSGSFSYYIFYIRLSAW